MPVWRKCADARVGGERRGRRVDLRGQPPVGRDHPVRLEDFQRGQRGAAGERVAGVGVRMQEAARGVLSS
jgi:hypothetical protein